MFYICHEIDTTKNIITNINPFMKKNTTLKAVLALAVTMTMASADAAVFERDFSTSGSDITDWTIIDANSDGNTWQALSSLKGISYDGMGCNAAADDWLFTPAFAVTAGKHYLVQYVVAQRGSFGADAVAVMSGYGASAEAMTTLLGDKVYENQTGVVTRYAHFMADRDGSYNIGFKVTSPADNGVVVLKSIKVVETAAQTPQPAPAMTATPRLADHTVMLKWYNAKYDSNKAPLPGQLKARIYCAGSRVGEIDVTAGAVSEYVVTPATFAGQTTFSVAMVLGDKESAKTSKTINLDDLAGERTEVKAFSLLNNDDGFKQWTIENLDGDAAKWEYDATRFDNVLVGGAYHSYDKDADDWFISPAVELTPGTRYILAYKAKSGVSFPASFSVSMGTAASASSQTTTLATYNAYAQNGFGDEETAQFTVPSSGSYHFGFRTTNVQNALYLSEIKLYSVSGGAEPVEEPLVYEEPTETVVADDGNAEPIEAEHHQNICSPGVRLYADISRAQLDQYTMATPGIFRLTPESQYDPDYEHPDLEGSFSGGVAYNNGILYACMYDATGNIQEVHPIWRKYDAKTFELLSETTLPNNCECTTVSITYDASTDKIYGLVKDYYSNTHLVEIDPATGTMTRIGEDYNISNTTRVLTIGCNAKGVLYCIFMDEEIIDGVQTHFMGRINKTTGQIANLGQVQGANMLPEDILYNMKFNQTLFFDNSQNKLYWMFQSSSVALGSTYTPIFEIDQHNCQAVLRTWIADDAKAVPGAYFTEPAMLAPAAVSDVTYTPAAAGATEGTLSFTMPTLTYDGTSLGASSLTYAVAEVDGSDISLSGTANPGEVVSLHVSGQEKIYNVEITVTNVDGASPAYPFEFVMGYDTPGAVTNVKLVESGPLTTTLTWDAPATGVHGLPYDPERISYIVLQYPNKQVASAGTTERSLVIEHDVDMQCYIYAVFTVYDGVANSYTLSNPVVMGAPIDAPYGGVFTKAADFYNYYTIIDANEDSHTWTFDTETGAIFYPYNYEQSADDWIISPPIKYYSDAEYELQFSVYSSNENYPESLEVTFGNDKTIAAQSNVLLDIPEVPTLGENYEITTFQIPVDVNPSGVYYYGFHAYSQPYMEYLVMYDIRLNVTKGSGVSEATATTSDFIAYDKDGRIVVINPAGYAVNIYTISGVLVSTSSEKQQTLDVTPGVYVVKAQGSASPAVKVMVK